MDEYDYEKLMIKTIYKANKRYLFYSRIRTVLKYSVWYLMLVAFYYLGFIDIIILILNYALYSIAIFIVETR